VLAAEAVAVELALAKHRPQRSLGLRGPPSQLARTVPKLAVCPRQRRSPPRPFPVCGEGG
jgi:hypothetical protein